MGPGGWSKVRSQTAAAANLLAAWWPGAASLRDLALDARLAAKAPQRAPTNALDPGTMYDSRPAFPNIRSTKASGMMAEPAAN